ncbi:MAG: hypothetical protein K0Q99_1842 [Clostridia bacterium]|jgi:hypothetical protein|nr:hypothetical protein [Clostridia bacterium]
MNDNQNNSNNTEKPGVFLQILMGMGIAIAAYVMIFGIASLINTMIFTTLTAFVVLAFACFLIIRFFRTGYKAAAIAMLVLISPLVFLLMVFGACALTGLAL